MYDGTSPCDRPLAGSMLLNLALLATLVLGSMVPTGEMAAASAETGTWLDQEQQAKRLRELKQDMAAVEGRLARQRRELNREESKLREIELQIQASLRQLGQIETRRRQLQARIHSGTQRAQDLEQQIRSQQGEMAAGIRSAWALARQGGASMLLSIDDPAEMQRMLTWFRYLTRARARNIDHFRSTIQELAQIRSRLLEERSALAASDQNIRERRATLLGEQASRSRLLATLQSSVQTEAARLAALQRDQAALESLLQEVSSVVLDIPEPAPSRPFVSRQRQLPWPLRGTILQKYGNSADTALGSAGIVINAVPDSPVKAVHPGRVVFANWWRGFGLLLILDHGEGYMSLYGYNQTLTRETGDWVEAGDVLATSGSTRGGKQSGLYFEVRHNGKPADPLHWLADQS